MSYRDDQDTLAKRLADLERRVRLIEQPGARPPDPGWVLREVSGELLYLYVPTGAAGPVIGTK